MSEVDDLLSDVLKRLPKKPSDKASQTDKKRYSELMSAAAARAFGEALRRKGLKGTLPCAIDDTEPMRLPEGAGSGGGRADGDHEEIIDEEDSGKGSHKE